MNMDIVQGRWRQAIGILQQRIARRKNDDGDRIEGSQNQLIGLMQERKGYAREGRRRPGDREVKGSLATRFPDS
jgi:uncharacterized protein YjbJ (UPF0337 family)